MLKPNNSKKEPAPDETKPVPEGKPAEAAGANLADEAEDLCAELERFFRGQFGEIPAATDLGELRAQQAGIRNLVQRASAQGGGAGEKLLATEKERDKFKDAATRVHADFLNYQARTKKDLQRAEEQALRSYVSDLLPILDSLDLSVRDAAGEKADVERLREALQLIDKSLHQTLAVRGLERIAALGKPFDPNIHEASAKRPANPAKGEKPNQVVEELRAGYLWKGLLLRPVQVLVSE
jgi:molecular chaperone GrpE